jgi:hypothetical protein
MPGWSLRKTWRNDGEEHPGFDLFALDLAPQPSPAMRQIFKILSSIYSTFTL